MVSPIGVEPDFRSTTIVSFAQAEEENLDIFSEERKSLVTLIRSVHQRFARALGVPEVSIDRREGGGEVLRWRYRLATVISVDPGENDHWRARCGCGNHEWNHRETSYLSIWLAVFTTVPPSTGNFPRPCPPSFLGFSGPFPP